jgi:uncharacterized repeat protein (TIGR01451 family)
VRRFTLAGWQSIALAAVAAVCAPRSAYGTLPRIDPTGQRLFVWDSPPPLSSYKPEPGCPKKHDMLFLRVAPAKIIAPVGSEVVLVGSVCGPDGYMHSRQRVEWMLAPGGVGQFVALGNMGVLDQIKHPQDAPRKLDNSYAIGTTSARYVALTRGTPTYDDDVPIQKGQAWVTVTSPVEGASYVTAYSPNVYGWDQRQRTSTIYWVDAQWAFPPPANNPVGTRHVFNTTVTRRTDRSPLVGWIVRYEITGGPAANFAANGGQVIEQPTDSLGQAAAEIVEQQPAAGTNTISIQIIRPAELPGGYGQRLVVASGSTSKTWSATSSLTLRAIGPSQATIGSTVTYRIEVNNPGPLSARQVVATNQIPAGLTFVSSNPPAQPAGRQLQWNLGDLAVGQSQAIEADFRADQAGTISNCAVLSSADGHAAQSCATTTITAAPVPMQAISLSMTGPPSAAVGQDIEFVGTITNRGTTATPPLVVVDRFDAGLQNATSASPIELTLPSIQPGQSQRVSVTLRATQAGKLSNSMEVQGSDRSVLATSQASVTATAQGPAAPAAARPTISVKKTGPTRLAVGQIADFLIEIANTGQVPATQLKLADNYDPGLEPTLATDGHARDGNDLVWTLDRLPPGSTVRYQIRCQCVSPAARACNRATVTTAEGVQATDDACLEIAAAQAPPPTATGTPRLTIDVADLVEPVGVGRNTTYQVKVTNVGQAADSQVVLTVTMPAELTPVGVGPVGITKATILVKTVRFEPVATIAPGETLTYQIQARADQPGQARIVAQATSAAQPQGIVGNELTTVFAQ